MESIMDLLQAVNAVQKEVSFIRKDGNNRHQNYNFASIEGVISSLRDSMIQNGLCLIPFHQEIIGIQNSGKQTRFDLKSTYNLHHIKSASSISVEVVSSGSDHSDKGFAKAMSMAFKYALLQTFLVPRGMDDPDKTENSYPSENNGATSKAAKMIAKKATGPNRIYLTVPFEEKDQVREAGGRWDPDLKKWYCQDPENIAEFGKWLPQVQEGNMGDSNHETFKAEQDESFLNFCKIYGGLEHVREFIASNNWPNIENWDQKKTLSFISNVKAQKINIPMSSQELEACPF